MVRNDLLKQWHKTVFEIFHAIDAVGPMTMS